MSYSGSFSTRKLMLALLAASAVGLIAQDVPTYKAGAKVVTVLATVRDKKGKIVNDLNQNDFKLEEDGRPQTISYFTRDTDLPLTLGLLLDTSGSQRATLDEERSASGTFVDSVLRANKDTAFLIHFDRQVELLQDLTKNPQQVSEAVSEVAESAPEDRKNSGSSDPNDPNATNSGSQGRDPNGGGYRVGGGTHLYDAIFLGADELMSKQQGRKAIVVLSDGVDRGSKVAIDRAIEAAQRADTIVYSIYYSGNEGHGFGRGDHDGGGHRRGGWGGGWPGGGGGGWPGGGGGGWPGGGGGGRGPQGGSKQREPRVDGKKILERILKETGGRMFEVSKKETLGDIYKEIQDELRNQYDIGYAPDKAEGDSYRKITLETTKKDYTVQAREGYYPSKPVEAAKQEE